MTFDPAIPPSVAGNVRVLAPERNSGWSEKVLPYLSDDKDNFLLVSASVTGAGAFVWTAYRLLRENAGDFKWLVDRIRGVKPPKAEVIDNIFKTSDNFFDGVKRVKDGWQKMEPEDALEAGLKWVYENHPRYNGGVDGRPPALDVTAADVGQLMKVYAFTTTQIGNVAYVVNQDAREKRWPLNNDFALNEVWEQITRAIIENARPRKASSLPPASITTTQKLLEDGNRELEALNNEVTKALFEKLARSLAISELPQAGPCHVAVGSEWAVVRNAESALESVHGILGRLKKGEELTASDGEFIQALKDDNPVVKRIYEIATTPSREGIDGKRRLLQLMRFADASEATSRGISAFFDAVSDKKGPVILIVHDETGKKLFPRMIVRGLANGKRMAKYERPYYTGMSSYHPGEAYMVKGEALTKGDAAMIVDSRNEPFFILETDMEHFKNLAGVVASNEPASKSYLGRAYLRFFNTIQAIYLMTNPDFKLLSDTPPDVPDRARWLRESNWVRTLDADINLLREGYLNVSARVLGIKIAPQNGRGEAIEPMLHTAVSGIADRYVEEFGKTRQAEFRGLVRQLERAVLGGDSEALQTARGQIRKLALDQLGGYKRWVAWTQLQDVAGDARLLRRISPNKFSEYLTNSKAEPPADIRNFVVAWTSDANYRPSLEAARKYARDNSEKAFAEYDLLIRSDGVDASTTITALAELAELSYDYNQIPRAGRALDMIDYMLLSGFRLPEAAREKLLELVMLSDTDPILRMDIPYNLRIDVAGKAEARLPAGEASQLGKRLRKRLDTMPEPVRNKLSTMVEEFRGEMFAYSRDFLTRVSVCMDDKEFWRFVRHTGENYLTIAESVEEQGILRPFFERAREFTGVYTRFERLPKAAKTALKPLLEIWRSRGYDWYLLTSLAVATPAEAESVRAAFGVADDKISEVAEFQRKVRTMIGEEAFEKLNPTPKVAPPQVMEEARVEPSLPPAKADGNNEVAFDAPVPIPDMQPRAIRWIKRGVRETVEIGSPALFGAAVFLGVGGAVREIFGVPKTEAEGLLQGYDTIGLSMAAESAIHKGIERFVWRKVPADARPIAPQPQPFSLIGTLGSLGLGMIVYRLVHGASDMIGIDELLGENIGPFNVNEVVGLTGTGALFGASQTILSKVAPSVASDIARHRVAVETVRRTGGSLLYESPWSSKIISGLNILKRGAAALMIAEALPTIGEAITNKFDDQASILARDEWYSAYKDYNSSRGIFGEAQDVPWYERVWHSTYNAADVVVPASWTRNIMPLWDDQAADWYATCRWKLKNGYECR